MEGEVRMICRDMLTSLDRIKELLQMQDGGNSKASEVDEQYFYKNLFLMDVEGQLEEDHSDSRVETFHEIPNENQGEILDLKALEFINLFAQEVGEVEKIQSSIVSITTNPQNDELCELITEKMELKNFAWLCFYLLRETEEFDCTDEILVRILVCPCIVKLLRKVPGNQTLLNLISQLKAKFGGVLVKFAIVPALSEGLLRDDVNLPQFLSNIDEVELAHDILMVILKSRRDTPFTDLDMKLVESFMNDFQLILYEAGVQSILGAALELSSTTHGNNARFGKFLLTIIKKMHGNVNDDKLSSCLHVSVSNHATFLKKALETELKKLSASPR